MRLFLLWQRMRFHGVAENVLMALHGKLNIVAQWFEYAGLVDYNQ